MSPRAKNSSKLSRRYSTMLRKQLSRPAVASSRSAESLGHQALAGGLDRLDLARIHEQALITLLPDGVSSKTNNGRAQRAARFFVAALGPIAKAHRIALQSIARVDRLKLIARRRTVELAASQRQLKREMHLREAVETTLDTTKRHYDELLKKSRHMQEQLRRLSHDILAAHEDERRRISRELHDEIGQTLTAINVKLSTLKKDVAADTSSLKKKIDSTQRLVERSMNTVHRFARELRPALLDDLGLLPALRSYMKDFTKRTHIPIRFTAFAAVENMSIGKRTALYRVAQEAITNVGKHAQASLLEVSLKQHGSFVQMEIHDNGKAFDVERVLLAKRIRRLGLLGMRERVEMVGGSFAAEFTRDQGTTIRVQLPS